MIRYLTSSVVERALPEKVQFTWAGHEKLELIRFDFVDDSGMLHKEFPLMEKMPHAAYGCGIYTFRKHA